MLVLSRRPNEDILFPNLAIRIRILRVTGNVTRLGIEAPPEIRVVRDEIAQGDERSSAVPPMKSFTHALRNRLNKVMLGLYRFQQQWQDGQDVDADVTFQNALDALAALDRELPQLTNPSAPQKASPRKRCRTLLIEDDPNERELLAGILGMNGCECETAADGQGALDYLASHELPDVVLLDMGLPQISGPQFLERIRREPRCQGLRVFAVSGTTPDEVGVRTGPGGVDAWFRKPLNPSRLWEAIQESLKVGGSN